MILPKGSYYTVANYVLVFFFLNYKVKAIAGKVSLTVLKRRVVYASSVVTVAQFWKGRLGCHC